MSMESNPFSLCGRTILVTGGSSGIGRAVAVGAARMGARIAVLGRTPDKVQETLSLLEGTGHVGHVSDLTKLDGIEGDVQAVLDRSGPFGGLVHSAGASDVTLLRDIDMKKAEQQMRLNWLSFMALSQAICRRGRYAPGLSVVALASISALTGQVGLSAYAGTKGALIASVRSLASEYAPRGIRFNCISPCPVDTPMQRETRSRLGEEWYRKEVLEKARLGPLAPEDVADPVLFLLSDASRRITGTNMIVDGGWSLS